MFGSINHLQIDQLVKLQRDFHPLSWDGWSWLVMIQLNRLVKRLVFHVVVDLGPLFVQLSCLPLFEASMLLTLVLGHMVCWL